MTQRAQQGTVRSYRDLIVWQKSLELVEEVYHATRTFPKEETYGLTSQMRRAAVSVASNIAEGHARNTRGEFLQLLGNARGSLAELQTQTTLAARLKIMLSAVEQKLNERIAEVGRLLNALRSSIRQPPAPKPQPLNQTKGTLWTLV